MSRNKPLARLTPEQLSQVSSQTIFHYQNSAHDFLEGTRDHDVSQNIEALVRNMADEGPYDILDFGCGPGRDLLSFQALGHRVVGLDGCQEFVELARKRAECEVLHQDFLKLDLKPLAYDGVFANASLFHVPTQELERVLLALYTCLRFNGVFFCSNPRGSDIEQFDGERYGAFLEPETWGNFVRSVGFVELESFYRPSGRPKEQQPWLATVWRKPGCNKDPVEAIVEPGLL